MHMLHQKSTSTFMVIVICQVRHGPGSTYFVDPVSTFLSQNVVLTQSLPLNLTLPITSLKSEGNEIEYLLKEMQYDSHNFVFSGVCVFITLE